MPAVSLICPHCEKPVEIQVAGVTRTRPCPECGETLVLQMAEKNTKARRRALLMGGAVPETPKDRPLNLPQPKQTVSAARIGPTDAPPPPAAKLQAAASDSAAKPEPAAKKTAAAGPPAEPATAPEKAKPGTKEPPAGDSSNPPTDSITRSLNFMPSHEPQVLPGDAFERMRMDPEIKEFRKKLILGAGLVASGILLVVVLSQFTTGSSTRPPAPPPPASESTPAVLSEEPVPPPVPEGSLVFKPTGQKDFTSSKGSLSPAPTVKNLETSLSIEALRKFLAAPDWKQRKAWCRDVPDLEKQMSAFYATHADAAIPVENIIEAQTLENGFYKHTVVFEGGGRRSAYVQPTPAGPRVDWASFTGAGEMGWEALQKERPATPVLLRVMVGDAFYYENQFGNPGLLKCVKLTSVADPGAPPLHAYCDRSSELCQQIEFLQRRHGKDVPFPLIMRVKYPLNSPVGTQVWITEIVAEGWLAR